MNTIKTIAAYQVVFILYFSKSLSSLGTPTSAAKHPLEISPVESSPPYDPNHPATASTSTEIQTCA